MSKALKSDTNSSASKSSESKSSVEETITNSNRRSTDSHIFTRGLPTFCLDLRGQNFHNLGKGLAGTNKNVQNLGEGLAGTGARGW